MLYNWSLQSAMTLLVVARVYPTFIAKLLCNITIGKVGTSQA